MSIANAAAGLWSGKHSVTSKGRVSSVREDYTDPEKVHVSVKLPKVKRKAKTGSLAESPSYEPTQHVCCPKSLGITVGDLVSITTSIERSVK